MDGVGIDFTVCFSEFTFKALPALIVFEAVRISGDIQEPAAAFPQQMPGRDLTVSNSEAFH